MKLDLSVCRVLVVALIAVFASGCARRDPAAEALAAAQAGQFEKAIKLYSEVAKTSNDPGIFGNRGNCYSYTGNLEAALADYQTALDKINARSPGGNDPILPYIYFNRGKAYELAKKFELAVQNYEKTISIKNDYPDVTNNLAWLLGTCSDAQVRNPTRAIQFAEIELKRFPENPAVLDTVAACYAAAGDFTRATSTQEKAISLCPEPKTKDRFKERLTLYKNQKPYIDSASPQ